MKYGFEGISDSQLISGFSETEEEYFIKFIDGAYYTVPISEKNKQELLTIMLNQASERNNSDALKKAKRKRRKIILSMIAEVITATASIIMIQEGENNFQKIIAGILAGISGIGVIISGVKYTIDKSEIEELQKYGIYLAIKDKFDECADHNLLNGVLQKADVLNINTLDNYSLKDLKMIKANIERSEKLYPHFEMGNPPKRSRK